MQTDSQKFGNLIWSRKIAIFFDIVLFFISFGMYSKSKRFSLVLLLLVTFYAKRYSAATNDTNNTSLDPGDDDPKSKRQLAGSHKSVQHPPNSSSYFIPGMHVPYGVNGVAPAKGIPTTELPPTPITVPGFIPPAPGLPFAKSPVMLPPTKLPTKQKFGLTTLSPKMYFVAKKEVGQPWMTKKSTLYDDCGRNKTCFGFPDGCISTNVCLMAMSLWPDDDPLTGNSIVNIALAATNFASRGYVSIGFSTDHHMGDDFVLSCLHAPTGPQVFLRQSYNNKFYQNIHIEQTSTASRIVVGYAQMNGVLTCFLKLDTTGMFIVGGKDTIQRSYDLFSNEHHILMAFGKYNDEMGEKFGNLERHHAAVSSAEGVRLEDLLQNPKILYAYRGFLIEWHAITEIIVHAFLLPASIIMAKYGQEAFSQTIKAVNMPLCALVHISMTSLAVILSLIGVIAIAREVGWASHMPVAIAHSIFGILIYILYLLSCIVGVFLAIKRKDIQHYYVGYVNIYRWCHWCIGNIIVLVGMGILLLAPEMKRAFVPCIFRHLAGFLIFVHILTIVIMSFHTFWLSTILGSQIAFQLACYGPMVPFEPETDEMAKGFTKLDAWAGRRRAVIFYFLATFMICVGMIGVMCFPLTICFTPY